MRALALCCLVFVALPAAAEEPATPALRVGISPFEPFVILGGEQPRGYSIDLFKRVAEKLRVDVKWVEHGSVSEKLARLESAATDVAIGGITLTREREEIVDFTHPSYEAGLSILIRAEDEGGVFARLWLAVTHSKISIILGFLLLIVVAGHLIWLAERGADAFNDKYNPGVLEGMYWAIVTASTVGYGDKAPVRWPGRGLAALLIIISLPMFALFTAELASALTINDIQGSIQGPEDLSTVRTGVLGGTASATWAAQRGLSTRRFDKIDDAYRALSANEIDAVVYDAPSLLHYAQTRGRGVVRTVGGVFQPQNLGMAVREGSRLREQINRALLELMAEGEVARLKADWFGRS
jgi:ABC-type amino acid transport substrate-binding protein